MDIVSYLLGKKSGGVTPTGTINISTNGTHDVTNYATADVNVTPNLQTKSVTITQNGTTTVSKDSGYDGLQQVNITTSVSGSVAVPSGINFGASTFADTSFYGNLDFSNVLSFRQMFEQNIRAVSYPYIETSKGKDFSYMFRYSSALVSIPAINTSKGEYFTDMLTFCSSLTTIPVLNFSSVNNSTGLNNICSNCANLSSESLNNLLESLLTATSYIGTKTLKQVGLNSTQATTCTGLSNWAALQNAGWTTGY